MTVVVVNRGSGGMEPKASKRALSTKVAVDGGGGDDVVPVTIDGMNNTMATAAIVSFD